MPARAAGIPKPTHSSPPIPELILLSEVLPMMGIAFWCVWAAYTSTELPEAAAATMMSPEVAADAAEPPEVVALIAVIPEVMVPAAEPPEVSVVSIYDLSACPVTAREAVCVSSSCPVTAMEAVCDLLPCSEPAMEACYELLSCPDPTEEATSELSALSVTLKDVGCEIPDCFAVPIGAICESSSLPVMAMEAVNKVSVSLVNPVTNPGTRRPFNVCPVNHVTDKITTHKLSVCSVSSKLSDIEPLVCSISSNVSDELSVRPILVIESIVVPSICPASINRSEYELSVLPVSVSEWPTPASVNAPGYKLCLHEGSF